MKSAAVAVIGALCCGASTAGAFVVPVGRPSGSSIASSAARRSSVRRTSGPSMSSVATPTTTSVAPTQEPERRPKVQVRGRKRVDREVEQALGGSEDRVPRVFRPRRSGGGGALVACAVKHVCVCIRNVFR